MVRRSWPLFLTALLLVLLVFGVQSAFVRPDDFSASPELVAHYADDGRALVIAFGSIAVVVAGGLLLILQRWLLAVLAADGASVLLLDIARGAGTVAAALIAAGGATWSVTVWNGIFYDDLSAEATKLLLMLGWMLVSFAAMVAASMMVLATSLAMRSVPSVPSWLAWSGYLAAVLLLFGAMVAPLLALPLWLFAATIRLRPMPATP